MLCSDVDYFSSEIQSSPLSFVDPLPLINWESDSDSKNSVSSVNLSTLPTPRHSLQAAPSQTPVPTPVRRDSMPTAIATLPMPAFSTPPTQLTPTPTSTASFHPRMPTQASRAIVQPRHVSDPGRSSVAGRFMPYGRLNTPRAQHHYPAHPLRRHQTHELRLASECNGILRYCNPMTGERYAFCKGDEGRDPVFLPALSRLLFGTRIPQHGRIAVVSTSSDSSVNNHRNSIMNEKPKRDDAAASMVPTPASIATNAATVTESPHATNTAAMTANTTSMVTDTMHRVGHVPYAYNAANVNTGAGARQSTHPTSM